MKDHIIVAATRLRLRSIRFLPSFLWYSFRIEQQISKAYGNLGFELKQDPMLTFWTRSLWLNSELLKAFHRSGTHQLAKPKLKIWCDEAVHAHWSSHASGLPSWDDVERRLNSEGHFSVLDHPSENHQDKKSDVLS